jgi:hypothetical protein
MSFSSDDQEKGVKAPAGGNIVQLVNSMVDNTGVFTKMNRKRQLDDRTHRIKPRRYRRPSITTNYGVSV